jgi:hypothetical protein
MSNLVKIRKLEAELFHAEGRTDGRTDGRTEGQTGRQIDEVTGRETWQR